MTSPRPRLAQSDVRVISTAEEAIAAAHELAAVWSRSAANVDAERRIPVAELQALSRSGLLAVTRVTTRPMNAGIIESSRATKKPTANSAINRPLAWRAKCQ